ncbi:MAG: signal peptidase I [Bdellovibrionales bacterium]|nr:signal peptidase I [Bdellovibrionales bacterium]
MNKKFWTEGLGSFFIAILIALTIRWAFLEAYVIPTSSMLPTLLVHDHIFVNKMVYGLRYPFMKKFIFSNQEPQRGEVTVFNYPENEDLYYIKRVIGLPGDQILYENGNLYINDQLVEKKVPQLKKSDFDWLKDKDFSGVGPGAKNNYIHWEEELGGNSYSTILKKGRGNLVFGPYTVPPDHYFVMGDNRDHSQDSRFWSEEKRFVPRKYLVGRAMFVWLSCEETLPYISVLCDPRTIRWKRFFHSVH